MNIQSFISFILVVIVSPSFSLTGASKLLSNTSTSKCKHSPTTCGMPGMPGTNGVPGIPGVPGSPGRDGIKGAKGNMGTKGETGKTGATGKKGEACYDDPTQRVNWKQCVWKAKSDIDSGNIKECVFEKRHGNTALKVSYQGTLSLEGDNVCRRWFFKFNGHECGGPMPIDAAIYEDWIHESRSDTRYPLSFEGYCENLGAGRITIEFWVGAISGCTPGNTITGWGSVSRILVEEVPPSQ